MIAPARSSRRSALLLAAALALVACSRDDDATPKPDATAVDDTATHHDVEADLDDRDIIDGHAEDPTDDDATGTPPPGSNTWIVDDDGAVLLLRGLNVDNAAKGADDMLSPIGPDDVARMQAWGFNAVRLLLFWAAVEPEPGRIDHAYLAAVRQRVDLLHAAGIHVVLDMHQDVYSRKFCCDGAPEWAIRDDGEPFTLQSSWFLNYYQPAVKRAFDNFWDTTGPHADLQEHFVATWIAIAEAFRDHPGVLAYDLFNEPFPGSPFDVLEALTRRTPPNGGTSRVFDETKLGPFHQRLIDAIRTVDPDTWIFFESRYGAPANGSPCYLPPPSDPRPGGPRVAYAPHLYSVTLEANNAYAADDVTLPSWRAHRAEDAERLAVPIVVGEWGLPAGATDADRFYREAFDMLEADFRGWLYWSWDPSGPTGWALWNRDTGADNPNAAILVRPYPARTPGTPRTLRTDPIAGTMTYAFDRNPAIPGPLEIRIPASWGTPEVDTTPTVPTDAIVWDPAARTLRITPTDVRSLEVRVSRDDD